MKTKSKKFIGGLMVVMIITTIGVILVSAQSIESDSQDIYQKPLEGRWQMCKPEPFMSNETRVRPFFYNLTEEQQNELKDLMENLKESGANCSEIKAAIQEKLDDYGILDEQLDNAIQQTQQRLDILNREKELRDQGYSWDEINQIILDEFGVQAPAEEGHGMIGHGGHGFGPVNGSCGCIKR